MPVDVIEADIATRHVANASGRAVGHGLPPR